MPRRKFDQLARLLMLLAFAEEVDFGDDRRALAVVQLRVRTLASSQRAPISSFTWPPTWPDRAMLGSGSLAISPRRPSLELEAGAAAADLEHAADRRLLGRAHHHGPDGRTDRLGILDARKALKFIMSVMAAGIPRWLTTKRSSGNR
jgi:hypothetical protein